MNLADHTGLSCLLILTSGTNSGRLGTSVSPLLMLRHMGPALVRGNAEMQHAAKHVIPSYKTDPEKVLIIFGFYFGEGGAMAHIKPKKGNLELSTTTA